MNPTYIITVNLSQVSGTIAVTGISSTLTSVISTAILTGQQGIPGVNGSNGAAATISVGSTTTGAAGTSASVANAGTSSAAIFNFTIPKGADGTNGTAATITAGTTTTGAAGTSANVTNSGTSSAAVFNFTVPQGAAGSNGTNGTNGSAATIAVGTTTTLTAGSSATVTNVGTSGAATFNFGIPQGTAGTGTGDMLKATYDPASVNAQLAADSAVVHKTGDSMSGALSVAITSGATTPITATVDSAAASQPAFLAKNNTNYAHGSNIIKAQMLNASDTGAVVRIENAGTGKNISSANGTTETFSVDKTGAILSAGVAVPTISSSSVITNKDLTSGTNTFPTLNQSTTGSAATITTGRTIGIVTGDATSAGSTFNGSANNTNALTLATVNTNVGAFGSATQVAAFTVNAKGLTTAASAVTIQIAESQVTNLTTDLATKSSLTGTETLTNKRVTKRVTTSSAPGATPTWNTDNVDRIRFTGLAAAITSMTTNLTGTPADGDELWVGFIDNATPRAITWGAKFTSSGVATLLATTVASKQHWVKLEWDSVKALWVAMAVDAVGY